MDAKLSSEEDMIARSVTLWDGLDLGPNLSPASARDTVMIINIDLV